MYTAARYVAIGSRICQCAVLRPPETVSEMSSPLAAAALCKGTVMRKSNVALSMFADALVAGPLSSKAEVPMLLTPQSELHAEVAAYLSDANIEHVVLMGGTAALSQAVEDAIEDLGIVVDRMAGE